MLIGLLLFVVLTVKVPAGGTNGGANDQLLIANIQDGSGNEGTWQVTYTNLEKLQQHRNILY